MDQGDRFLWDLLFSVWRCGKSKRSVFGGVLVVVVVMVVLVVVMVVLVVVMVVVVVVVMVMVVQCSVTVGWPP